MDQSSPIVLDYYRLPSARLWPVWLLLPLSAALMAIAPQFECACASGKYKVLVVVVCNALLFLRTAIALIRRERGNDWIAYCALAIASFIFFGILM